MKPIRFFIGDIHGCAREFEEMICKLKSRFKDVEIYSVGDVINKGPDSVRCLELCVEHKVTAIRGNHEEILIRIVQNPPEVFSEKELRLLSQFRGLETRWVNEIKKWAYFKEWDDLTMVHAGLDPRCRKIEEMDDRLITTIRTWDKTGENLNRQGIDPAWFRVTQWPRTVVFGHWAQLGLMVRKNFICLDSGCVYGKALSAWSPDNGELIQVKARKVYARM